MPPESITAEAASRRVGVEMGSRAADPEMQRPRDAASERGSHFSRPTSGRDMAVKYDEKILHRTAQEIYDAAQRQEDQAMGIAILLGIVVTAIFWGTWTVLSGAGGG